MTSVPAISHRKLVQLHHNPVSSATAMNLVYVKDDMDGISRKRKGKGFSYLLNSAVLKDKEIIERIQKLAIPPAWENVWICCESNGHIQATGFDAKKRKQYRYHPQWNEIRRETKFHSLAEFGKVLPQLRKSLEKDLSQKELTETKVIATAISLMERTYIRVGNEAYEKANGSFGLTTLKDKHVEIEGDTLKISFIGKKGISQNITLKNKKLASIVKDCRDIPGKELFQYFDEHGQKKSIDSGMINNYIKESTGGRFTAKDFRTWAGSLSILRAFGSMEKAVAEKDRKSNILKALDTVSMNLGNTRTVCKKYYVHPGIIEKYERDELEKYLRALDKIEVDDGITGLTAEEKLLMKLL